jgi:hypothetical protein
VVLGRSKLAWLRQAVFKENATRQRPANSVGSVANDALRIQGELTFPL